MLDGIIYDIETYKACFIFVGEDLISGELTIFEISDYINDGDSLIKYLEKNKDKYFIGYNILRFDAQVIQYIIHNWDKWYDLSSIEIVHKIYDFAQEEIDRSNYEMFPTYREEQLWAKQVDLYKIHHFDNKNKRVGLKRLEFEMDLPDIEELPIDFRKEKLTGKEIANIIKYCINDKKATRVVYNYTIGEVEHPEYKERNKIQLRIDIEKEFNIPCLNYSDPKIGDEIIKSFYSKTKGITIDKLPKKGFFRKSIKLRYCIAKYVKFQTPQLQTLLDKIRKTELGMEDEFKLQIDFHGNIYSFMKGGLHSDNKPIIFEADEDHFLVDWDVSSFYPAIIINNEQYPYHLGPEFLQGYKTIYDKRLELKPLSEDNKSIKGIVEALKLSLNGVYGKSSDIQSWIYDKQLTLFTTITGELSLMMLIEAYELAGIKVISANTDGVTLNIHKSLFPKMEEINSWWCKETNFKLEKTDFKKIVYSTVNDYIAIKTNREIKKKGDFMTNFLLDKNKSKRIIPLALEKYFVDKVPIEETIQNHKNIFDFCIRQKSSKDFHYEGIGNQGYKTVYNKLIRYYVSKEGEKLLKIKNPECETRAAAISECEAPDKEDHKEWVCKVVNHIDPSKDARSYDIDYEYYIRRAKRIIDAIESPKGITKKSRRVYNNPNQINLF